MSSHKYSLTQQHPAKRAFITGAASGLGKAFCLELAQDQWTLGIADIKQENLANARIEFEKLGAKVLEYTLDVSDRNQ